MRNTNQKNKGDQMLKSRESNKKFYYNGVLNIKENKQEGVETVTFNFTDGKFGVLVWYGKQAKPKYYYSFSTEKAQQEYCEKVQSNVKKRIAEKKALKEAKKKLNHPYKVGDILSGSWGYDQTNPEAYQVVAVTGKTIEIQEICLGKVEGSEGFDCCYVKPIKDAFKSTETIKKVPQVYGVSKDGKGTWYVKLHYCCSLSLWEGEQMYNSWYA